MKWLVCLLPLCLFNLSEETASAAEPVDLLVVRDGWGRDNPERVKKVLESVAAELQQHFPERKLPPIVVHPTGGPITYYQVGPRGEIVIALSTGNNFWAQYVYQFAHEFCHVLCRYDQDNTGNKWFEESLCELASMYALKRLAETWQTEPPMPEGQAFAPHLQSYLDDLLKKNPLPENRTFAQWYAQHANELHNTATKRDLNSVVARELLPLVVEKPEYWEAVQYINEGKPRSLQTLAQYLEDWQRAAPAKHHPFIREVAKRFNVPFTPAEVEEIRPGGGTSSR